MNLSNSLLRPNFFDRQQLTAADLRLNQEYVRERLRRHNRFLHGWGVVCGAEVRARIRREKLGWELQVNEGYAITPQGDEIYIPESMLDICKEVAACFPELIKCPEPGALDRELTETARPEIPRVIEEAQMKIEDFFNTLRPSIETAGVESAVRLQEELAGITALLNQIGVSAGVAIQPPLTSSGDTSVELIETDVVIEQFPVETAIDTPSTVEPLPEVSSTTPSITVADVDRETLGTVYLVARPETEEFCPRPAMPIGCQPPGGRYEHSRIREIVRLEIRCELPPSHQGDALSCEALEEVVCNGAHVPYPSPTKSDDSDDCVVLATISVSRRGIEAIDDLANRRQLLSTEHHQAYLACSCEQTPPLQILYQLTLYQPSSCQPSSCQPSSCQLGLYQPSSCQPSSRQVLSYRVMVF